MCETKNISFLFLFKDKLQGQGLSQARKRTSYSPVGPLTGTSVLSWCLVWPSERSQRHARHGTQSGRSSHPGTK